MRPDRRTQLLRSRSRKDTIPKPTGLGWRQAAFKSSSSFYQALFKLVADSASRRIGAPYG
jgi:hypothetical protein